MFFYYQNETLYSTLYKIYQKNDQSVFTYIINYDKSEMFQTEFTMYEINDEYYEFSRNYYEEDCIERPSPYFKRFIQEVIDIIKNQPLVSKHLFSSF